MKVYISLPITGHDIEEVEARCIFAKAVLERKGHTPVSPLDIDHSDLDFFIRAKINYNRLCGYKHGGKRY